MPNQSQAWLGRLLLVLILALATIGKGSIALAQERSTVSSATTSPKASVDVSAFASEELARLRVAINAIWIMIAAFLVMSLKAGFSLFETGLIRAKNVAHTMSMNLAIYAVALMGFWSFGFALMYGGHDPFPTLGGSSPLGAMVSISLFGQRWDLIGFSGFFLSGPASHSAVLIVFVLQAMFVDTAATIPTGAMAERWRFKAFLAYGFVASALIYPVYGCWVWGDGWLSDLGVTAALGNGMVDFAGSSVVHMTGGMMALAGALTLGPRIGKFGKSGSVNAIPGHNVPMVVVGTLILAFGWFGLNAGRAYEAADLRIASIATCTLLATGAGCLVAMGTMWIGFGKPDPTMSCNGLLAGAVAISASCAYVNPIGAVAIGAIAGALVVGSILFIEKGLGIDDPVGAISVHGVCGAFGTLCVGLFANGEYGTGLNGVLNKPIGLLHGGGFGQLLAQLIGIGANVLWTLPVSLLAFAVIGRTMGNRVSALTEVQGLDVPEMGVLGYVPEETYAVQTASQDYLATFGPGVPTKGSSSPAKGSGKSGGKR
jgi:ammonium transporter, Amt family